MIDIFTALGWLNEIDDSSLNNEARRLRRAVRIYSRYDRSVRRILERLRNSARSSNTPLEKAEILLHCATIEYSHEWFSPAAADASEALLSYQTDNHRRAVALWMLGMVQWKARQNHQAYTSWDEARKNFQMLQILYQRRDESKWYQRKIWDMNVECAARPEEIATWLNHFERSSLRWSSQQIVNRVRQKLRQQAYPNIYVLVQDFHEANGYSQEVYERAEVYLEFGLAIYQMGNVHPAIELLRKAVQNFDPGIGTYHKQVVARSMLGALEWTDSSLHTLAFADWARSICDFKKLMTWAQRDSLREKEKWYDEHCGILRAALSEQMPRKYQDLVYLVQDNVDKANRLIELERHESPHENLSQLIDRAIESFFLGRR